MVERGDLDIICSSEVGGFRGTLHRAAIDIEDVFAEPLGSPMRFVVLDNYTAMWGFWRCISVGRRHLAR